MNEPMKPRRSRWLFTIAAASAVLVLGAGFLFAAQFQSAAQQEANATAPAAGPVLAEVTEGSLVGEASFTGDVGPSTQTPLTILPRPEAFLSVVTGHPVKTGATVSSGQVLTEVNGRPVFGARSPFPFYRDMGRGDSGPDVEALQHALAARSYAVVSDGRFGPETAAAVERWYLDAGYGAPARSAPAGEGGGRAKGEDQENGSAQPPAQERYVPVTEILAMPTESAHVLRGLRVGQGLAAAGQPDLVLGSAEVVVTITVPVADLGDVVAGDAATISVDGITVEGTVGDIRAPGAADPADDSTQNRQDDAPPDGGEGPAEVAFSVLPQTALPSSTGRARVTVTQEIVAQNALIVPVLAVSDRGSGGNILTRQRDDGSLVEVPVMVLGTLQGEVAVEPVTSGALEVGDLVRVA